MGLSAAVQSEIVAAAQKRLRNNLYGDKGAAHKAEAEELVQRIASDVGVRGQIVTANLKGMERAAQKVSQSCGNDWLQITDVVRSTIVCQSWQHCLNALNVTRSICRPSNGLSLHKQVINSPNSNSRRFSNINVVVRLQSGYFAEIQINSYDMIYGGFDERTAMNVIGAAEYSRFKSKVGVPCGLSHIIYEIWRIGTREDRREMEQLGSAYHDYLRSPIHTSREREQVLTLLKSAQERYPGKFRH